MTSYLYELFICINFISFFIILFLICLVISSVGEPMAGWVDNWNGPTGIIAAAGKGFFRSMLCHENKVADLVPVDIVINLMICAAWRTATARFVC
jgi:fatty acyl-CoA reductase